MTTHLGNSLPNDPEWVCASRTWAPCREREKIGEASTHNKGKWRERQNRGGREGPTKANGWQISRHPICEWSQLYSAQYARISGLKQRNKYRPIKNMSHMLDQKVAKCEQLTLSRSLTYLHTPLEAPCTEAVPNKASPHTDSILSTDDPTFEFPLC